jgi:hypothetical protein
MGISNYINHYRIRLLAICVCLTVFLSLPQLFHAQVKLFDVVLLGKVIGETKVERHIMDSGEIHYTLRSKSEANVLFTTSKSDMYLSAIYKDGSLLSTFCSVVKNGVKETMEMVKKGSQYVVKKNTNPSVINANIVSSSLQLYFQEPKVLHNIFSERMGMFFNFINPKPGIYSCKIDEVNNIYKYNNGTLYEVEMSKPMGSVFLRLKK